MNTVLDYDKILVLDQVSDILKFVFLMGRGKRKRKKERDIGVKRREKDIYKYSTRDQTLKKRIRIIINFYTKKVKITLVNK